MSQVCILQCLCSLLLAACYADNRSAKQSIASAKHVTFMCVALKGEGLGLCSENEFSVYGGSKKLVACCTHEMKNRADKVIRQEEHALSVVRQEEKEETNVHTLDLLKQEAHTLEVLELEEQGELAECSEQVDIVLALMLLGSVSIVMSLFYLVNHHDLDIREYSWHVVSSTLAIFTSILGFEAAAGILGQAMVANNIERHGTVTAVTIGYCQLLVWFSILQVAIGCISHSKVELRDSSDSCEYEARAHAQKMLRMKTWSTLLAHMAGFAAIHAGGKLQHLEGFSGTPLTAAASVIVNVLVLGVVFLLAYCIRSCFGQSDEIRIWEEETEEAENEIASLALSFLGVQAIRFQLGRNLPSIVGLEPALMTHDVGYVYGLLCCAVVLGACSVFVLMLYDGHRVMHIVQTTASMSFAWCIFYASKECVADLACALRHASSLNQDTVQMRVMVACALSCASLALIFILDKVEHMIDAVEGKGNSADKAIKSIIGAIGILVGFSWEQAFDGGVEAVAEIKIVNGSWSPVITKFILASLLASIIVPAWSWYILKNTCLHVEVQLEHKARRNMKKNVTGQTAWRDTTPTMSCRNDAPGRAGAALQATMYIPVPSEAPGIKPVPFQEMMGIQCGTYSWSCGVSWKP